jgi:hypothetical protein
VRGFVLTAILLAVLVVSVSAVSHTVATQPTVWNIVALGDSDATGEGRTRLGWVGRYARLLRQKLGLKVVVTNALKAVWG